MDNHVTVSGPQISFVAGACQIDEEVLARWWRGLDSVIQFSDDIVRGSPTGEAVVHDRVATVTDAGLQLEISAFRYQRQSESTQTACPLIDT